MAGYHAAARVDVADHLFRHVDFATADGAVVCDGLAVDVAGGNYVLVDYGESAHAAARQGFNAVGAHAAAAKDRYAGLV